MKSLLISKYFYIKGGAENLFFQTAALLEKNGHKVCFFSMQHARNEPSEYDKFFVSNVDYDKKGMVNALRSAGRLLYSLYARRRIEALIKQEKPDIAHLHNIYHQISPSIIDSLMKYQIPIVMTLHDYKLVCAAYSMFASEKVCEACKNSRYYQCLLKKCVKDSLLKSLLNTFEMYLHHSLMHIYNKVDIFISPSQFLKAKFEEMGFRGKIEYLPNFVLLKEFQPRYDWQECSIVYFGRLSKEKGLLTLIKAIQGVPEVTLKIIGEGLLRESLELEAMSLDLKNVKFLGYKSGEELKNEIRRSMFIVLPSECYENNPRSIIEGFALGKPAVGAQIGGIPELVRDNETGFTFEAANVDDLRRKIKMMLNDVDKISRMGKKAREFVEQELNEEKHYQGLMKIYEQTRI